MNKKLIITLLAIVIVVGAGAMAFAIRDTQDTAQTDEQPSQIGKSTTVSGKVICLTPKDTSGPVNSMCAIGLEGDDGKNYALAADDPTVTGGMTGQRVSITGSFTEQTSTYDAVGMIKIESIQPQ